ncbi:MAG: heme biosynthesis protein HemY [Boseongicola sp.]|nr:MAG: heme biosynthesis protein HemY [Boseongicola sp.]
MLWSLSRIILFVALVGAAAWGAGYLLEAEGGVRISVADTEFTLDALVSVLALIALLIGLWIALKLTGFVVAFLRFLNGDETAITRYFARNRERRGYDTLAEGMMALASGDGRTALNKAEKAERFLQRPDLTTLLTAQAAEMSGDRARAEVAYRRLLKDDRTRFVGVRGIMLQKLNEGDTDMALKLAGKAFALKPRSEETQDILLKLQAGSGDWTGARSTLGAKLKYSSLPRDVHKRRDAVLALGEARDILDEDKTIEAREAAITANRLSPDLIPAGILASDGYVEQGKPKYATRVIRKAWTASPHPSLAAAFARIQPDETPAERIKRFRVLTAQHNDHAEIKMLEAELQIAAEDFPAARKAMGDLVETDPTMRSLTIMAAIERGSGADDVVVKGWLARALNAPRDPQWVCESCGTVHGEWHPVCGNCDAFDSLDWTRPAEQATSMVTGSEMLPLIVGQIESPQELEETSDAPADEEKVNSSEGSDDLTAPEPDDGPEQEKIEIIVEAKTAKSQQEPPDYSIIDAGVTEGEAGSGRSN